MFVVALPLYPFSVRLHHMYECSFLGTSMNKVDDIFLSCVHKHCSDLKSSCWRSILNFRVRFEDKTPKAEVFYNCFVGINKSTAYFSLAFIHDVRMFVVASSLHLSRGRLSLRVHCLIDGIMCVFRSEHKPNAGGTS